MKDKKTFRTLVYLVTFFYALHYSLTLYIESSFLEQFLSEKFVGLMYTISAFLSILAVLYLPRLLVRLGNYKVALWAIGIEGISLFGLSIAANTLSAVSLFLVHQVLLAVLFTSVNVLLESFSQNRSTGETRGVFLTILNVAILAGPLSAQFFVSEHDQNLVFLWSMFMLIPTFIFMALNFKEYKDPDYREFFFLKTAIEVLSKKDIFRISVSRFILEFFYAIMVIYTPIYLHQKMGMPFSEILGTILPVALIPFVVFPYVLGFMADKKWGEKELLSFGFILGGIATSLIAFIETTSVAFWAILLLITRIGAAFVETMGESYFFKQVDARDSNLISFFINLRQLAFIVAPFIATAFLSVFDFRWLFLFLGLIFITGLRQSLFLTDTR